jgi:hypothetical protein
LFTEIVALLLELGPAGREFAVRLIVAALAHVELLESRGAADDTL